MPDALIDEVNSLVEWPVVYAGSFDPAFLAVPQECLILTMQQNQKYFALAGPAASSPIGSCSSAISRPPTRLRSWRATSACYAHGSPMHGSSSTRTGRCGSSRGWRGSLTVAYHSTWARSSIGWLCFGHLSGAIA